MVCIFTRSYYINELRLLKFGKRRIMRQIREELIQYLTVSGKKENLNTSFLQNVQLKPMAAASLVGKILQIGDH